MSPGEKIKVSTPGRICLFGEHQDYLSLPVIPCAVSLRLTIEGSVRSGSMVSIRLPDINSSESFSLFDPPGYRGERDYFRSGLAVMRREGFSFSNGFECAVIGKIPISAGTSSSSALVVSWINFLSRVCDQRKKLNPEDIARLAYQAEVLEFDEPGGMMDQYSTALGGAIFLKFHPAVSLIPLKAKFKSFVLGDSQSPKDTKGILSRVKTRVMKIVDKFSTLHPGFSLQTTRPEDLDKFSDRLDEVELRLLAGTLRNRDITFEALRLLQSDPLDDRALGALLTEHQNILRDVLLISTPKIDRMLDAAAAAGAYGGKINGSGGGGCMFAYAPDDPAKVSAAIEKAGGKAYVISADQGTRIEEPEGKK